MSTAPPATAGAPAAAASVVSQQTHVPPPATVDRWPNCTPQLVLNMLKQLAPTEMGANSKLLPNTYHFWASMSTGQVRTTLRFWDHLPNDKQMTILAAASASTSLAVDAVTATAAAATQDVPTNKHDITRLLHVRMDSDTAMAWAATRQGYGDRRIMDARNSSSAPDGLGGGLHEPGDPWYRIAERYMDYVGFQPQSDLIRYANGQPFVPYSLISADMTGLVAVCNELRPTLMSRKDIPRDGLWSKTLWRKTKGTLSAVFEDFTRSGTHRSADMADAEWNDPTEQQRWMQKNFRKDADERERIWEEREQLNEDIFGDSDVADRIRQVQEATDLQRILKQQANEAIRHSQRLLQRIDLRRQILEDDTQRSLVEDNQRKDKLRQLEMRLNNSRRNNGFRAGFAGVAYC
ncbi:hypothetical protein B484DRAFT_463009 [Ochromonadaceae sp. CCMP2298]|nr:hypothetical protein B484DRAFT_463009 [Ochromonadaceae sp. CCMP2298]